MVFSESKITKITEKLFKNNDINNLKNLNQIIDSISNKFPVTITDKFGKIIVANSSFLNDVGYKMDEVIGQNHSIIKHPDTNALAYSDMWNTILNKKEYQGVIKNIHKNGNAIWHSVLIKPILDENSEILYYFSLRINVTRFVQAQHSIELKDAFDTYTDLPSYSMFKRLISRDKNGLLLIIGLDSYKETTSLFGDDFAKELLSRFGRRINLHFPSFRCYSLEELNLFAVYRSLSDGEKINEGKMKEFILESKNTLQKEFKVFSHKIRIDASIGVAHGSSQGLEQKARFAFDTAYEGNLDVVFFEGNMNQRLNEIKKNKALIDEIKNNIEEQNIFLNYQPIVNLKTGETEKYECLVRMKSSLGKTIYPDMFLDVAKKSRYYINITKRVIDIAFDKFKERDEMFSINISYEDIRKEEFKKYLLEKINTFPEPNRICFEILEDEDTMKNFEEVNSYLKKLKKIGAKIAIDDFGVGYTNISNVLSMDIDYIKIDGSIIKKIADVATYNIIKGIVGMAKAKGIKVVGEYVETNDILNALKKLNIDEGQGYYLGKPSETLCEKNESSKKNTF